MLAVGGGILISGAADGRRRCTSSASISSTLATVWDLVYTVVKSLGFGLLVGMVVCVQGLGLSGAPGRRCPRRCRAP